MTNEFLYAPLELHQFAQFHELQRDALLNAPEVFGSDYDWFDSLSLLNKEQRYEEYLNYPYRYLLGAIDAEGRLIGMIGFSNESNRSKTRHKGHLWGMYVRPEYRGRGIASALVKEVINTALEIGCEQIHLAVSTHNGASYALYLRLGFIVYGTELHAMKMNETYVDEYLMVKFVG